MPGVVSHMDNMLIFRKDQTEHDQHLEAVKQFSNVFRMSVKVSFLGYVIDVDGIRADLSKTDATAKVILLTITMELRRYQGMANQLSKFTLNLAQLS